MGYRLTEVASMLGVSTKTLRRAIAAGQLESFRVGLVILVTPAAIEAYINSRRVPPRA
jgi:excisionase family DNA binding protein